MSFTPRDFFIGVVHLFVIFLPGALVVTTLLFLSGDLDAEFRGIAADSTLAAVLLFTASSYFLGHLVSFFGSHLEDRSHKRRRRKVMEKEEGPTMRRIVREIVGMEIPDAAIPARPLRRWAIVMLRRAGGALYTEVETKDADRRFFRNVRLALWLVVAAVILQSFLQGGSYGPNGWRDPVLATGFLMLLIGLSQLRYRDQDRKFTRLAFELLIASKGQELRDRKSEITHAGGVVFTDADGGLEYLLVSSRKSGRGPSPEWVLPKGHVKPGESPEAAALREVEEESGVVAELFGFLGFSRYVVGPEPLCVANYLMQRPKEQARAAKTKSCEGRSVDHVSYAEALRRLDPLPEACATLKLAAMWLQDPAAKTPRRPLRERCGRLGARSRKTT